VINHLINDVLMDSWPRLQIRRCFCLSTPLACF